MTTPRPLSGLHIIMSGLDAKFLIAFISTGLNTEENTLCFLKL